MPFSPIAVNSKSFETRAPGVYQLSTVVFPSPENKFVINQATTLKSGDTRMRVDRIFQKDVTQPSGAIVRTSALVSVTIDAGSAFTATELDVMVSDISEFLTAATISRMAQSEI